jgi:hypothetical protein
MAQNDRVTPRLAPITHKYLDDLLRAGTHGTTIDGVARSLIEEGVRQAIRDGIIAVRNDEPEDKN